MSEGGGKRHRKKEKGVVERARERDKVRRERRRGK